MNRTDRVKLRVACTSHVAETRDIRYDVSDIAASMRAVHAPLAARAMIALIGALLWCVAFAWRALERRFLEGAP
jgi:hypothetical protein